MVKWSEARYALLSWTLSEFQFVDLRGSLTRAVAHCLEYGRLQDALPEQPQVNRLVQLVLEDCSTLPHELHFLQLGDVSQRIAGDRHEIRPFPCFDGSRFVAPA